MLQQTQVKTVIEYYRRFLKRFPNIRSLAEADESEVLKLWEGLGYYRRARQLHAAAKSIMSVHGGRFPTEFAQVVALPGIGRYTAGALLSIALDRRLPILEGNTIRLFARLLALPTDPRLSSNQARLWEFAENILPEKRVGDFNQALMELGSEICKPIQPNCPQCPLMNLCPTFARGLQQQIPAAGKKTNYESVTEAIVLVKRKDKFLVKQCQPGERWAGLYDFPRFQIDPSSPKTTQRASGSGSVEAQLANFVKCETGLDLELVKLPWVRRHGVTRFRIQLLAFESTKITGRLSMKNSPWTWITMFQLNEIALNITARDFVEWLSKKQR